MLLYTCNYGIRGNYMFPAERIKLLREINEISQTKLANDLFIGRSTMSEYENGIKQPPIDVLVQIADYFDVSLDYLAGRTDKKISIQKLNNHLSTRYGNIPLEDLNDLQRDEKEAIGILIRTYQKYNNRIEKKK